MSILPSDTAKQKAIEILNLLWGMTIEDIRMTIALVEGRVAAFSEQRIFSEMLTNKEEIIIEIRERVNIAEIISDFVALKKEGKNYVGLCPFHSEKTPSFTVNEEKGIFHCFGCGAGGNVFNFLMRVKKIGFDEAVRELANKYKI